MEVAIAEAADYAAVLRVWASALSVDWMAL